MSFGTSMATRSALHIVTLNLDRRAGPAWRVYLAENQLTVYPSIWRDSGCGSHFIIWNDAIYWMDMQDDWPGVSVSDEVRASLLRALSRQVFRSPADAADQIGVLPWLLATECRRLTLSGVLEEGTGDRRGLFRIR